MFDDMQNARKIMSKLHINAFQTILRNSKMPILSIICYIVRNLRNFPAKYQNNLILWGFEGI